MTTNELSRWKTDETLSITTTILEGDIAREVTERHPKMTAGLGDLFIAYSEHLRIRRWRRKKDWEFVRCQLADALNRIEIHWPEPLGIGG